MKVTDLRTRIVNLDFRNCVIVEIETDAGITGIAETVMKRWTHTVEASVQRLRDYLVGSDPTTIEAHWERMYRDSFWVGGPLHATAISVIDCALWDILAKSLDAPIHKLFGGPTRERVPAYCHCPGGESPEIFAANARACAARGFRGIKTTLPLFYGAKGTGETAYSGTNGVIDRSWKETEYLDPSVFRRMREFFLAAREALGPSFGIAVDCHGRLGFKAALRLCRALEDLDLMFIEEPLPPENPEMLAELQRQVAVPIAAGERWATIHGARPFIERHAVDILQCDLVNCGGFTGMKKIAALAEAQGIGLAPHNPNGPLATVMNLHFAAMIPNFQILETVGSPADAELWRELLDQEFILQDGCLPVPTGPGLGVDINKEAMGRHPYRRREGWR